jgi:hypothetical protein
MRIDPEHAFAGNVAYEPPLVVRMRGRGLRYSVRGGVGDEEFLPGNAEAFPAMLFDDFRRMFPVPR